MKKPITKKEKLFLIKVLLNPSNQCLKVDGRDIEVLKAIKQDVLDAYKIVYPIDSRDEQY